MTAINVERGKPVYGIDRFLPYQGEWSEELYLGIVVRNFVEYTDGLIEILAMPTTAHQDIVIFLLQMLLTMSATLHPGKPSISPLRLRTRPGKFREPDLLFVLQANRDRLVGQRFWTGADLVVEVVSPDDPKRDHEQKRLDYAEGHIAEYWIVDPQRQTFTVLKLEDGTYAEHGVFRPGETATSALLAGVSVDVSACFAAGQAD